MIQKNIEILLASKSPRRKKLIKGLGIPFKVVANNVEESYPKGLSGNQIAIYLAEKKSKGFNSELKQNQVLLTSDTVVWQEGKELAKPKNETEAKNMLQFLSGNTHQVITGVCLRNSNTSISFADVTQVTFKNLSNQEIDFYIQHYQPFDKAGAYGIQEWIGFIGVEKIEGSYFNVVGLPIQRIYEELHHF